MKRLILMHSRLVILKKAQVRTWPLQSFVVKSCSHWIKSYIEQSTDHILLIGNTLMIPADRQGFPACKHLQIFLSRSETNFNLG